MRRAVMGLVVGGLLLGAGACGTAQSPGSNNAAQNGGVSLSPELAQTKKSCEAISAVYNKNMGSFAQALSSMVAGRQDAAARKEAQQKLKEFGTALRAA